MANIPGNVLLASIDPVRLGAINSLFPDVYPQLRQLARALLARERTDHTLPATGLVHETYLRLVRQRRLTWEDRAHFVALAVRVMRQVLVDHARRRRAAKRDVGRSGRASSDGTQLWCGGDRIDILSLDDLLKVLGEVDPRQLAVVELRFFGGLTVQETACVLRLSTATVEREWAMARAWLRHNLD